MLSLSPSADYKQTLTSCFVDPQQKKNCLILPLANSVGFSTCCFYLHSLLIYSASDLAFDSLLLDHFVSRCSPLLLISKIWVYERKGGTLSHNEETNKKRNVVIKCLALI